MCSHNTNGRDIDKPCSVEFPTKEALLRMDLEAAGLLGSKKVKTDIDNSLATLTDIYEREGLMGIQKHLNLLLTSQKQQHIEAVDELLEKVREIEWEKIADDGQTLLIAKPEFLQAIKDYQNRIREI